MTLLEPGQLVESTAGRDRGSTFLVLGQDADGFIWVVDGQRRPVERPKKKNRKHLKAHPLVDETLGRRWAAGEPVTNQEVWEALQRLQDQLPEEPMEAG